MGLTAVGRRRGALVAAAVLAVVVLVVLLVRPASDDVPGADGSPSPVPAPTPSASAEPTPTPAPASEPTPDPSAEPPAPEQALDPEPPTASVLAEDVHLIEQGLEHLEPVESGEIAQIGGGVTVALTGVERVDAQASGPGEVSGPALALTVTVTNGGSDTLTLDGAVVNLYGQAHTPGSLFASDPRNRPLVGALEPGDELAGTYVMSSPDAIGGELVVSVSLGADVVTPIFVLTVP